MKYFYKGKVIIISQHGSKMIINNTYFSLFFSPVLIRGKYLRNHQLIACLAGKAHLSVQYL